MENGKHSKQGYSYLIEGEQKFVFSNKGDSPFFTFIQSPSKKNGSLF